MVSLSRPTPSFLPEPAKMTSGLKTRRFTCGPHAVDRRPCDPRALRKPKSERERVRRMKIHIPTPLRQFAAKQATVTVAAGTVGEALDELTVTHPELKKHLYSDEG